MNNNNRFTGTPKCPWIAALICQEPYPVRIQHVSASLTSRTFRRRSMDVKMTLCALYAYWIDALILARHLMFLYRISAIIKTGLKQICLHIRIYLIHIGNSKSRFFWSDIYFFHFVHTQKMKPQSECKQNEQCDPFVIFNHLQSDEVSRSVSPARTWSWPCGVVTSLFQVIRLVYWRLEFAREVWEVWRFIEWRCWQWMNKKIIKSIATVLNILRNKKLGKTYKKITIEQSQRTDWKN